MWVILLLWLGSTFSLRFPQKLFGKYCSSFRFGKSATQNSIQQDISTVNSDVIIQPSSNSGFDWEKQWYPLILSSDTITDNSRPHSMQLLGKNIVLWHNGSDWQAFSDSCPHRGARLSEGRIEPGGRLLCAYHGWTFNSSGSCVVIPQTPNPTAAEMQMKDKRSCARSYPVREVGGIVFVWGKNGIAGDEVFQVAQSKQPMQMEELTDPALLARVKPFQWAHRDLPYGWDIFFENVLDPAHVYVSHHNTFSNRYTDPSFVNITRIDTPPLTKSQEDSLGFMERFRFSTRAKPASSIKNVEQTFSEFRPPIFSKVEYFFLDGSRFILAFYVTPTVPGRCRLITAQIQLTGNQPGKEPAKFVTNGALPQWLSHPLGTLFLHQDHGFLHYQQQSLLTQSGYAFGCSHPSLNVSATVARYIKGLFMPNKQDVAVMTLRNWIEKTAGGGPHWGGERKADTEGGASVIQQMEWLQTVAKGMSPEELYNTYEQHTKSCIICQRAVRNLKRARSLAIVGAVAISALALWKRAINPIAAGVAVILMGSSVLLTKFMRLYHEYKFSHQDNN